MQLGLIGLGKMGGNMRERLRRAGHEVVGFDRDPKVSDVRTMAAMVKKLEAPRVVWVMVPAGAPTRDTIAKLADMMDKGDLIIDGGNSRFTDDYEHARMLKPKGIGYVDCGVSGGIWGLENGYGLMCGGDKKWVNLAMPIFDALRPEGPRDEGFVHAGEVGAGHYTKMVHNGIEYGLMAAYAEGYELLQKKDIIKDVPGAFKAWSRGTVVRSWLLDLAVDALAENPTLDNVSDYTVDSGEGKWTVEEAIVNDVPMPVISASLFARFASRQKVSPTMQMVAALRGQFGGHPVMTVAQGNDLRNTVGVGDADPTLGIKAEKKRAGSARKAAVHGRKAAAAGPSSGTGSTTARSERRTTKRTGTPGGRDAASAGPTSGTGSAT
ncbi:MAG TPA: decarboxylating 6-phosphogluconate dehydrogenase [Lapillicoccus sp.]|jgi:6-phosphogluconate dehydrogenase|uniref:phosphogluconate dehydrogenase (NAD(+)-dependent, decarboxylating) n=1 Tax=Lapillicoccus sp. TaxID=1909287 RepID=UPI002F91F1B2